MSFSKGDPNMSKESLSKQLSWNALSSFSSIPRQETRRDQYDSFLEKLREEKK